MGGTILIKVMSFIGDTAYQIACEVESFINDHNIKRENIISFAVGERKLSYSAILIYEI